MSSAIPIDDRNRLAARASPLRRKSLPFSAGAAVLCASLLINLLSIAAPLTALLIYDRVLVNDSRSTLAILAAGAIVVILLEALLRLLRAAIISRASAHADFTARNEVITGVLRQTAGSDQRVPLAELNGRLAAVGVLRELRIARLVALVDLPFTAAFLVLVGMIGGWAVALPASVGIGLVAVMASLAATNERESRLLNRVNRRRGAFAEAVSHRLHAIAAIASQMPVADRLVHHQLERSGILARQGFAELISRDVLTVFSQLLVGSVVIAGALTVLDGQLSLGGLAACTLLAGRALEPLQNCIQLLSLGRRARIARDDLATINATSVSPTRSAAATWNTAPDIRFDGVRIPGPGPEITVPELLLSGGEIVAISGDRGSGKTSLARALLGMMPVEGTLHVGGIDVAGPASAAIRRQSGYLPRAPQLPAGRLLDVLTGGADGLYADVRYLAHLIGLDEVIKRLPAGYDTLLRADATGELSAGIRQQIAICRVLAQKHKLIIADETTCPLDATTELRFAKVIRMLAGETTIVLLTDRPSLRAVANRRFDLSSGRLTLLPDISRVYA